MSSAASTCQAAAVGRELYSGMFDEFPDLKFVHTMFGGNWFALQNLLAPHVSVKKEAMNRLATNVDREATTATSPTTSTSTRRTP